MAGSCDWYNVTSELLASKDGLCSMKITNVFVFLSHSVSQSVS